MPGASSRCRSSEQGNGTRSATPFLVLGSPSCSSRSGVRTCCGRLVVNVAAALKLQCCSARSRHGFQPFLRRTTWNKPRTYTESDSALQVGTKKAFLLSESSTCAILCKSIENTVCAPHNGLTPSPPPILGTSSACPIIGKTQGHQGYAGPPTAITLGSRR